jgi:phage terminase small subunit
MALTPKQQRFVEEYLKDLNATAAARRAGYSSKNADKIGPELLGKTRVSEAIVAAKAERAARCKLSQLKTAGDKRSSSPSNIRQCVEWRRRGPNGTRPALFVIDQSLPSMRQTSS